MARSPQTLVALLRGINVGPHKRIAMADLRALLEELGYGEVRTLLQSGNAVFETADPPAKAGRAIERAIRRRFGMDVAVIVRTVDELAAVVEADPRAGRETDGKRYLVAFLGGTPDPDGLAEVTALPDAAAGDGVLYLWCPDGVLESPASQAATDRRLKTTVTARNWNTVVKLLTLARG
jgi:uncharacterized protein (DUF1697 family)